MAVRDVCAVLGLALGCAVLLSRAAPGFVPGAAGHQQEVPGALRGVSMANGAAPRVGTLASAAAGVAVAAAVLGAGLLRRAPAAKPRVVSCSTRRELAIAYEDSGIELLDNGKFAQGLIGAEGAWGRYEFDPVGFSKYTELVPYLREAELKHGRIAMLAWVGLAVPDFLRIPGERYSFDAIPVTIDAHDRLNGAVGVNFQILFWIMIVEFCCAKKVFEWNSLEVAGDYNLTALFWPKDDEGQRKMRLAELKNGRLAMVAFGGAITQAVLTRHPFPWLY